MNQSNQIYDNKRINFVYKAKLYFEFLNTKFDFDEPIYTFSKQSNGVIIADKFEFNNPKKNQKIVVSNSYHPVDYGFEINWIDLRAETEELIYNVLKENQDVEQNYIEKASEHLEKIIHGKF
ncbi:hypothetical protein [Flavobacterium tegetincola]|uniref:hypothetical protein n=1 Tax=Flavobacterium tegetincola TaxID=150172 RepID=UPI00041D0032|nr:hypothetical protein [Flavobacterium tegetincola]